MKKVAAALVVGVVGVIGAAKLSGSSVSPVGIAEAQERVKFMRPARMLEAEISRGFIEFEAGADGGCLFQPEIWIVGRRDRVESRSRPLPAALCSGLRSVARSNAVSDLDGGL